MKKSKIWIRACVHLLLCITLETYSSEIGNPITDDITRISLLKQNIPKDYKIAVRYIPKEVSDMCWVKLNVFHLEESLKELAHKFGNISSNRYNISIFVEMLQNIRFRMVSNFDLEGTMYDFECHYREERWQTEHYFEFVEDFLITARSKKEPLDCEPPPCPTTSSTTNTQHSTTADSDSFPVEGADCNSVEPDCRSRNEYQQRLLPEAVEKSLLSLLLVPIAALIFMFAWKVRSRRNERLSEQNTGEARLFAGAEGNAPPLDNEISEKNRLNIIETV